MKTITLTSDYGLQDGYVGAVKGVILSIAPEVRILDLAHQVPAQDVIHGAFALAHSTKFFPEGTIHVGIIDPAVGTKRDPICVYCDGQYYIGPNNGLFAMCAHGAESWLVYRISNHDLFLPHVSATFHGRDIFAPVAAHLARGIDITTLGPQLEHPEPLELPGIIEDSETIVGEVIYIDNFGNAVTNISKHNIEEMELTSPAISVEDTTTLIPLVATYADRKSGEPMAIIGSSNLLEIAIRDGHAANELNLGRSSQIVVHLK